MLGYSEEELLHKTLFDITVPSFNSSSEQFLNQLMTGELPFFTLEKQYERKDKAIIWGKVFSTIILIKMVILIIIWRLSKHYRKQKSR